MTGTNSNRENGFALFGALIVTILLIGLAGGIALTDREHSTRSVGALSRARTLTRAESITDSIADAVPLESVQLLGIGESFRIDLPGAPAGTVFITRLDSTTYWVAARAFDGSSTVPVAERRVARAFSTRRDSAGATTVSRIMQGGLADLF